jgi:hypothetical protein
MTRYFFDLRTTEVTLLDYFGQEFKSQRSAMDYAETIAYDLKHRLTDSWSGWTIDVQDPTGRRCFSLAVDGFELRAA